MDAWKEGRSFPLLLKHFSRYIFLRESRASHSLSAHCQHQNTISSFKTQDLILVRACLCAYLWVWLQQSTGGWWEDPHGCGAMPWVLCHWQWGSLRWADSGQGPGVPGSAAAHPASLSPCTAQGIRQHPALPTRGIHAPENDQQLPPAAAAPQPEDLCLPGGHSQRGLPARGPPPDALTPAPPGPAQPLLSSPVGSGPAAAEVEVMRLARGKWETRKTKHLETLAG